MQLLGMADRFPCSRVVKCLNLDGDETAASLLSLKLSTQALILTWSVLFLMKSFGITFNLSISFLLPLKSLLVNQPMQEGRSRVSPIKPPQRGSRRYGNCHECVPNMIVCHNDPKIMRRAVRKLSVIDIFHFKLSSSMH